MAPLLKPNPVPNDSEGSREALGNCTCNHRNQDEGSTSSTQSDNEFTKSFCDKDTDLDSDNNVMLQDLNIEDEKKRDSCMKDDITSPGSESFVSKEKLPQDLQSCVNVATGQAQASIKDDSSEKSGNSNNVCPKCKKLRNKIKSEGLQMHNTTRKISKPYYKFVWNKHLLPGFEGNVHQDWVLYVINGFIGQSSILLDFIFFLYT
jgi:hypothetical protein